MLSFGIKKKFIKCFYLKIAILSVTGGDEYYYLPTG